MADQWCRQMRRAVVLGAGVMGSQIAALLAADGLEVMLLDVAGEGEDANARATSGWKDAKSRKPAAFVLPEHADRIRVGNFRDHLESVKDADWVLEAVVEDPAVKRDLFARVEELRRPGSIVSSNTSGISIRQLAEGRSEDFRRSFLGTHFFNPPRYMTLFELIPTPDTAPELAQAMAEYADRRLGKGVITCKDTPLFVANRVGLLARMCTIWAMIDEGLTISQVDAVASHPLGRPKTGVFRLGDLIGLDTTANVARYLYSVAIEDERRDMFRMPPFIETLLAEGALGNKAGRGYYQKVGSEIRVLDWKSGEYRPVEPVISRTLDEAKKIGDVGERIRFLADAEDWVGKFTWRVLSQSFVYAAHRVGEICDSPLDIDRALRWGYNWEIGLFEIWDAMGVERTVQRLDRDGLVVPASVREMLRRGRKSFYEPLAKPPTVFELSSGKVVATEDPEKGVNVPVLKRLRGRLAGNDDASLVDIGDGVRCLEFHTKMNTLGPGVVEMLEVAMDKSDKDGAPLVIGGPAANFSAGANLQRLLDLARRQDWQSLDRRLQSACVRLERSGLAVVAAPAGLALGGGAEIVLRAPCVQAFRETNMGLVELRVGLIPAAGGTTEMLKRALGTMSDPVPAWPLVKGVFDLIRESRVAGSADEAVRLGYLRGTDRISVSRLHHLEEAKRTAIELAEHGVVRPIHEPQILCLGADALARLKVGLHGAHEGGYVTDYDVVVGEKLAWILCGGNLVGPRLMPEQYLLDLEREAFLDLLGDSRTQARIEHLLKTGKPLRN